MDKDKNIQKGISRREFLRRVPFLAWGAMSVLGLLRLIADHTEDMVARQDLEYALKILANPPQDDLDFGIISDPDHSEETIFHRANQVREGLGRLDHMGLFHNLEDLGNPDGKKKLLQQLNFIQTQNATAYIALGAAVAPGGKHLLHPDNAYWLEHSFQGFCDVLEEFGQPVVVRFLYEMNTPNFAYSPGIRGMSKQEHARGFIGAAKHFDNTLEKRGVRHLASLMFNPIPYEPFAHYASDPALVQIFDLFGMDVYDKSIFKQIYIGNQLISPGKESPKKLINGPIADLVRIAQGKPVVIGELGTQYYDDRWIQQFTLGLLAEGITTFSFFDVDKRKVRLLSEGDYRLSHELIGTLSRIIQFVTMAKEWNDHDDVIDKVLSILGTLNIPMNAAQINKLKQLE
jgi:hypothetical protein